jgi:hypothetical protein
MVSRNRKYCLYVLFYKEKYNNYILSKVVIIYMFYCTCFIVHDLFYVGRQRYYIHYWVEIDVSRWTLIFISRPFIFRTFGIEFASGLEKTSSGHYQILFGYQDTDSCTCFVSLQQLRFGNNTDKLV